MSILSLLLYTDLYVVIFKLLNFWVGKILGGGAVAVPTAMQAN